MEKFFTFLVICAAVFFVNNMLSFPAVEASVDSQLTWFPSADAGVCRGSMAECLSDELEYEMDSEINRRILATGKRYISYGALSRNTVPCSRRGASYYNCRQGAQANPYNRGCSAITRCRR